MTFKELEKLLKRAGWTLHATRGSHFYYVHTQRTNKVTVPNQVKAILKQAGIDIKKG